VFLYDWCCIWVIRLACHLLFSCMSYVVHVTFSKRYFSTSSLLKGNCNSWTRDNERASFLLAVSSKSLNFYVFFIQVAKKSFNQRF
jgi:hypothetical protein